MIQLRPGQRVYYVPNYGVEVSQPSAAEAAAGDWWDPDGSIGAANVAHALAAAGAESLAASYLRLAGDEGFPNIDPAVVGGVAPTWDAVNGWAFNGAKYLKTGIVPTNDQAYSLLVKFTGAVLQAANSMTIAGMYEGLKGGLVVQLSNIAGNTNQFYNGLTVVAVAPAALSGVLGVAGNQGYLNGAAVGGALPAWGGASARAIYIGALDYGSVIQYYLGNIQSIVAYKSTLTAPQVALVSAAMP
jgi:hypothetical protein